LEIGPVGGMSSKPAPVATSPALPPHSNGDGPLLIPDPVDYQADTETPVERQPVQVAVETAGEPELAASQVDAPRLSAQQLKIRRVFSQSEEDDESPGSLLVVVEAVNATDEPVDAVGAASLMIMARDESGMLKRIERWDFTAEETAAAWQSSHLGDGLHLELPLTESKLPEGKLELWGRVVSDDGAKLLTAAEAPYCFEADKLASMADAPPEAVLASTDDVHSEAADAAPAADAMETAGVSKSTKPNWRASTIRLEKDRVEGFATTAANNAAGWTTKPIGSAAPRVASASGKSGSPTWKRSSRAATTESRPEWSAER
jgi:hypothetical protein